MRLHGVSFMDVTLLLVSDTKGVHFLWDRAAVKSTPS